MVFGSYHHLCFVAARKAISVIPFPSLWPCLSHRGCWLYWGVWGRFLAAEALLQILPRFSWGGGWELLHGCHKSLCLGSGCPQGHCSC